MAETRRKFDQDFREGAVRLVRETPGPLMPAPGRGSLRKGLAHTPSPMSHGALKKR